MAVSSDSTKPPVHFFFVSIIWKAMSGLGTKHILYEKAVFLRVAHPGIDGGIGSPSTTF